MFAEILPGKVPQKARGIALNRHENAKLADRPLRASFLFAPLFLPSTSARDSRCGCQYAVDTTLPSISEALFLSSDKALLRMGNIQFPQVGSVFGSETWMGEARSGHVSKAMPPPPGWTECSKCGLHAPFLYSDENGEGCFYCYYPGKDQGGNQ
eukprot:g70294.t1